jgi:hypothetical protein
MVTEVFRLGCVNDAVRVVNSSVASSPSVPLDPVAPVAPAGMPKFSVGFKAVPP